MNDFFQENQELLLDLANTEAGKFLIGRLGQKVQNPIVKITQNSFHELVGFENKKAVIKATFFSYRPIQDIFSPIIEKTRIAAQSKYFNTILEDKYSAFLHFANLQKSKRLPEIFLSTITLNPASGLNDPMNERVYRNGVNESFSTIHSGAGTGADQPSQDNLYLSASSTTNQFGGLFRGIFCFGTGAIGAGQKITSATLSFYGAGKLNQLGTDPGWNVCGATPASHSAIAASDYGQVQTTPFSTAISMSSWNTAGYNDYVLNASGIAAINTLADSAFSLQYVWDIQNSFTGTWASGVSDYQIIQWAGAANPPKLVVNYQKIVGGGFLLNFL